MESLVAAQNMFGTLLGALGSRSRAAVGVKEDETSNTNSEDEVKGEEGGGTANINNGDKQWSEDGKNNSGSGGKLRVHLFSHAWMHHKWQARGGPPAILSKLEGSQSEQEASPPPLPLFC
jgi:hypothetical protein